MRPPSGFQALRGIGLTCRMAAASAASITLRNVTVAYSLPKNWLKPFGITGVRLNATCQNALFFLNPYPEGDWASWAGTYGRYPNLRKVTFGVNVTF